MYKKRALISFDGKCPMNCKHCYTYELDKKDLGRTCEELARSIGNDTFDIIYVSQSYENFFDAAAGLKLCNLLYEKYQKDIFIITRSFLEDDTIQGLDKLNQIMRKKGNRLYFSVSLCADQSYALMEDAERCPAPDDRIRNLYRIHECGIPAILTLRPVMPDTFIPVKEYKGLIEKTKEYIDAVVASGLILTREIAERLGVKEDAFPFLESGDSDYLDNMDRSKVKYVDVEKELEELHSCCAESSIAFFRHSMPALNDISARMEA